MIRYPQRALKGLVHLFRPYNDIEVYVEDALNRNMYEILIERILQGEARVTRVFSLGGCDEVLKACAADQSNGTRRRLYLIDSDFSIFFPTKPHALKYLYTLGVYTSENLLVSELAAIEVARESMPESDKAGIRKTLKVGDLLTEAVTKLRPLFVAYATKHYLEVRDSKKIHIVTAKRKVVHVSNDVSDGLSVCETKINKLITDIRTELMKNYGYKKSDIEAVEAEIEARIPKDSQDVRKYISGKTYLLPLIYFRLSKIAKCRDTIGQLATRLARYAELDIDPGLAAAVTSISKGGSLL